jgi:trigger factor
VLIDFERFLDGKPLPNGPDRELYAESGPGSALVEFDRALVGMNRRQQAVPGDVSADYANKALADSHRFQSVFKEIREKSRHRRRVGQAHRPVRDLEDLKREIRANLTQGYEKRIEQELNEQVFTGLLSSDAVRGAGGDGDHGA